MEIVITAWALDSYLDLKHTKVFTDQEYKDKIRPDTLLLADYPKNPKFNNTKFWSVATDSAKNRIPDGYKMKWHQVGSGKIQLRLPIGLFAEAIICEAYVKGNDKKEKRKMARFKTHLQLVRKGNYTECGRLT